MGGAIAVERGCGERVAGGLYVECGMSPFGRPVEHFLIDPPIPIDAAALGVSPRGVTIARMPGGPGEPPIPTVIDWVGSQHYPNVADFVEEVRRFGLSRRIPRTAEFAKLGARSQILLLHARAIVADPAPYWAGARGRVWTDAVHCPRRRDPHVASQSPLPMCAGIWWRDIEGGVQIEPETQPGVVRRSLPSFSYVARSRPADAHPRYALGAFARFPLTRIVAIEDRAGGSHAGAVEAASRSGLPIEIEPR